MDMVLDLESDSEDEAEELAQLEQLQAVLAEEDDEPISDNVVLGSSFPACSSQRTITSNIEESNEVHRLNKAIANNKLYAEKIIRLESLLSNRLRQLRQKLQICQNEIVDAKNDKGELAFRYINCGRPYFKDSSNFPAPDNDDAKMAKTEMYDFSLALSVPGWTVKDKSQFIYLMHEMSADIRRQPIYSKIAEIKRRHKNKCSPSIQKEIARLKLQAELMIDEQLHDICLPINEDYDWDSLANQLNRRHTAQEFQTLWKLFFHPSINKSSWSKEEHLALQRIASENNQQDWDDIAKKLNTSRTGYQCFVYYRTNMTNSFTGKKWTLEEVTYLKRLIEYFQEDTYIPWGKIAAAMGNRTKIQIYNKYMRLLEQRKGRFLPEEDAVILNCVERFGKNYKRMTNYLPGRSMIQIRTRHQVLSKLRVSTVWTVEDDRKLVQIMTNQDSMNFSVATQHFPGRNRIKLRSRYVTLMKWMKKHPNLDLEHAPRRGARRLNHGQASEDLNKAIEDLKNILTAEVATKSKKKKISLQSTESDIEDAIVATLVTELVKQFENKRVPSDNQQLIHIGNNQVVTSENFNMTNLRKSLIFLNSHLNEEKYLKSQYSKQYPHLGDNTRDISLVKLKSYSRKNTVTPMSSEDAKPDVWGTKILPTRNFVLPPHYATITGCKSLLSLVNTSVDYCDTINLHVLVRRNSTLKQQLDQVIERFFTLFTWPMLLSNEGPNDIQDSSCNVTNIPNSPAPIIFNRNIVNKKAAKVTEVINLPNEKKK